MWLNSLAGKFATGSETEQKMFISLENTWRSRASQQSVFLQTAGPCWMTVSNSAMRAPTHQQSQPLSLVTASFSSSPGHLDSSQTESLKRKYSFSYFPQIRGQAILFSHESPIHPSSRPLAFTQLLPLCMGWLTWCIDSSNDKIFHHEIFHLVSTVWADDHTGQTSANPWPASVS